MTASIKVELFGIPRKRAGVPVVEIETDQSSLSLVDVLTRLAEQFPDLKEDCIQAGRMKPGYIANLDGQGFAGCWIGLLTDETPTSGIDVEQDGRHMLFRDALQYLRRRGKGYKGFPNLLVLRAARDKMRDLSATYDRLAGDVKSYSLSVANAMWGQKTYPFAKDYLATIEATRSIKDPDRERDARERAIYGRRLP